MALWAPVAYTLAVAQSETTQPEREACDPAPGLLGPDRPLRGLFGIGPKTAERLQQQGIATLLDLLSLFPTRGVPLVELAAPCASAVGQFVRLRGTVASARLAWLPGRRAMVTVQFVGDGGAAFSAPFFNQPWLKNAYPVGQTRTVEGQLLQKGRRFVVQGAKVAPADAAPTGAVQLRYRELDGIAAPRLRRLLEQGLAAADWAAFARHVPPLPAGLHEFDATARELFFAMHQPVDHGQHERARRSLAVREATTLLREVALRKSARQRRQAESFPVDERLTARILGRLPFALSPDQLQAVRELWRLLAGPAPMGALLQGDVGAGKTAVAAAAALAVLAKGAQVAFLAPTEVLAEQHCRVVSGWLEGAAVSVQLLVGSLDARRRKVLQAQMRQPGPRLWFGTHALLSEGVEFARLGLVVVDEQHRFGVEQRERLVHKGADPHVLCLSATPIPQTLALSWFGDLDLVSLRQRPSARALPKAVHVPAAEWRRVVRAIARAARRGGACYVVCPTIGAPDEKGSAMRAFELLRQDFSCRLVHGRMAAKEQRDAIAAFRRGDCDVLVGTTVLEVGVDVERATLMVIVQPERFGLSTLHQLRGRVGRGARRGLCIACGERTERVQALCRSADGFALAEQDLLLRGAGELLGTQQSGFASLRALDLAADRDLLLQVRDAVAQEQA